MAKIGLASVGPSPNKLGFTPSAQQEVIFSRVRRRQSNLIIRARAGTGKTTTLVGICHELSAPAVFLAFNKGISTEVEQKLALAGISRDRVKAATFHSVGYQAWRMSEWGKRSKIEGGKLSMLADALAIPRKYQGFAKDAVSKAKLHLIGAVPDLPEDDTDSWMHIVDHFQLLDTHMPANDFETDPEEFLQTGLAYALKLLRNSNDRAHEVIDFDDQLYLPIKHGLTFWRYENVLIDEAQDTNRARREIAKRLLKPGGLLIAVGDDRQAIYGFTGADADALDLIRDEFQCEVLPLTVTYRCAASIVKFAQGWVPDIEARPDAPEGSISTISVAEFRKIVPEPTDAILCRNMAPLAEHAFSYLRRHIGCNIEGKDLGANLITMIRKWRAPKTIGEFLLQLWEYKTSETARLRAQYKEAQIGALEDKVSTLAVLGESLGLDQPKEDLIDLINTLFKNSDGLSRQVITLSTCHKSKGREWDRVYLIGRNTLMPSPYATEPWQLDQEDNLMYVAVTRAKSELIEVLLEPKPPRGR